MILNGELVGFMGTYRKLFIVIKLFGAATAQCNESGPLGVLVFETDLELPHNSLNGCSTLVDWTKGVYIDAMGYYSGFL